MPVLTVRSRDETIKCSSSCAVLAGQLPDALQYSASMPPTCKITAVFYRRHAHNLSIDGAPHEHDTTAQASSCAPQKPASSTASSGLDSTCCVMCRTAKRTATHQHLPHCILMIQLRRCAAAIRRFSSRRARLQQVAAT